MSFIPGRGEMYRESIRGREVEADLITRDYEHLHPEAEYGLPKRTGLVKRLLRKVRTQRTPESCGPGGL